MSTQGVTVCDDCVVLKKKKGLSKKQINGFMTAEPGEDNKLPVEDTSLRFLLDQTKRFYVDPFLLFQK